MTHEYSPNKYNLKYFLYKPISLPPPYSLSVQDYKYSDIPNKIKDQINAFNFPENMPNRHSEIEIEKMYSPLIIQSIIKENESIVSGVQFFHKNTETDQLPVEKSYKLSKNGEIVGRFNIEENTGGHYKAAEVGRLQISYRNINREKRKLLRQFTLWSVWLFIANYGIDFVYCMADSNRPGLKTLYEKKLLFTEVANVKYPDSDTIWVVYRKSFIDDRKNSSLYPDIPSLIDFYYGAILPICNENRKAL